MLATYKDLASKDFEIGSKKSQLLIKGVCRPSLEECLRLLSWLCWRSSVDGPVMTQCAKPYASLFVRRLCARHLAARLDAPRDALLTSWHQSSVLPARPCALLASVTFYAKLLHVRGSARSQRIACSLDASLRASVQPAKTQERSCAGSRYWPSCEACSSRSINQTRKWERRSSRELQAETRLWRRKRSASSDSRRFTISRWIQKAWLDRKTP